MKENQNKIIKYIFIILFAISFFSYGINRDFGMPNINYFFPHIISLVIFILAILKLKKNKFIIDFKSISILNINMAPELLAFVCCFFISSFTYNFGEAYIKKEIVSVFTYILPLLEAFSLIYLFGKEEAIELIYKGSILNYSMYLLYFTFSNGIINLFKQLYIQVFDNTDSFTMLEAHQVTFVFGALCLYYLYERKKNKKNTKKAIICFFMTLFGFKRILAIALLAGAVVMFVLNKIKNKKILYWVIMLETIAVLIGTYYWIYGLKNDIFKQKFYNEAFYEDKSGISNRLRMSFELNNLYEFNMKYKGKGLGFVEKYRENNSKFYPIDLHDDLLRKYIDYGFLIYGIYFLIKSYIIPRYYLKNNKNEIFIIYMSLYIMTIICWTTDNLAGYFNYLIIYYILIMNNIEYEK